MSGRSRRPPSALVLRAKPDLSDADLAALINRSRHLFGRPKAYTHLVVERGMPVMRVKEGSAIDLSAAYVIYDERRQAFVGYGWDGNFGWENEHPPRETGFILYPADRA